VSAAAVHWNPTIKSVLLTRSVYIWFLSFSDFRALRFLQRDICFKQL